MGRTREREVIPVWFKADAAFGFPAAASWQVRVSGGRAGRVVDQEGFVNLGQAPEDGGVGGEFFAHLNKGADDVKTHLSRLGTVQDIGGLQRAVLGEGVDALGKLQAAQGCHSL